MIIIINSIINFLITNKQTSLFTSIVSPRHQCVSDDLSTVDWRRTVDAQNNAISERQSSLLPEPARSIDGQTVALYLASLHKSPLTRAITSCTGASGLSIVTGRGRKTA